MQTRADEGGRALKAHKDVLARVPDLTQLDEMPAHARISSWLEGLIEADLLAVGDRLPTEVVLSARLGVSRMTLRQALATVEAKGLIERRRGRGGGSFIARPPVDFALAALPGFTEQMRRAGLQPGTVVHRAEPVIPPGDVRRALGLTARQKAFELVRVRTANGATITLEHTFLPAGPFPDLLDRDLTGSLYEVMDLDYDLVPLRAHESISPVLATEALSARLRVPLGAPLLLIERTSYAHSDLAVEFSRLYFRPDRATITVRTSSGRQGVHSTVSTTPLPRQSSTAGDADHALLGHGGD